MSPKVLVVDDERAIRDLLVVALEDEGYEVRCARDGGEGLAAVARERPDLVVSDVWMPCLDGVALARHLLALGIPVVLMSAVVANIDLPGVPVLRKPFDLDRLFALAARAVAARRPAASAAPARPVV